MIFVDMYTNQILDFDERHCINEYKSCICPYRCRSTNRHNDILKRKAKKSTEACDISNDIRTFTRLCKITSLCLAQQKQIQKKILSICFVFVNP